MTIFKSKQVKHAMIIGTLGALAYWACYLGRNILSVISPQMVETTDITIEFIGTMSTANMLCYAMGQLLNGIIGDWIRGKYLVSFGLFAAGVSIMVVGLSDSHLVLIVAYSLVGFFLSMLYAPLVKLIAENTSSSYAVRCCLGLSFASILGAPTASAIALFFYWKGALLFCGAVMCIVAILFFCVLLSLEKREIVKYREQRTEKTRKGNIKVLIEHEIVRFSLVSVLTGIVRTSVLFWIPTYLSQHLGFSTGMSAGIFMGMTCVQALSPYVNNLFLYERVFKKNRNKTLLFTFGLTMISFLMMFIVKTPLVNIIFTAFALTMNDGAAGMLWNVYCPSLCDTGMVSSATGYLDFLSYMSAAVANLLFANAIATIGWGNLILVWAGLMFVGVLISLENPFKKRK